MGLSGLTKAKFLLVARKKLHCLSKNSVLMTLVPTFASSQPGILESCGEAVASLLLNILSGASLHLQLGVPQLEMLSVSLA